MPHKHLGQHFLCDQSVIQRIVSAIAPKPGQHLVEIGPGQGAITVPVLEEAQTLEVIEFDRDLIPVLAHRSHNVGKLIIHNKDVLDVAFDELKKDHHLLRVFGNLPYNISTPLIFHLLKYISVISDMIFMLQREVAHRLAAKANTPEYGRLSVMVQYHCKVELLFDISPHAFYPQPKVYSSIVKLVPYGTPPYQATNFAMFESIVRAAFGQRRKTLRNSLKKLISDEIWMAVNINSTMRPENLTVKEFVELSNALDGAAL